MVVVWYRQEELSDAQEQLRHVREGDAPVAVVADWRAQITFLDQRIMLCQSFLLEQRREETYLQWKMRAGPAVGAAPIDNQGIWRRLS
jgi:hypothetical protein